MAFRQVLKVVAPVAGRIATRSFATSRKFQTHTSNYAGVAAAGMAIASASLVIASPAEAADAKVDVAAVKAAILKTMEDEDARRNDGTSIGPTFVRLAWHCAGTFSKADGSGGSNGCRMRYGPEAGWGANAGLAVPRSFLDPVKKQFPNLSHADLYTYAGAVAIEAMGGPEIPFTFGRTDMTDGTTSPPDGRLPNADMGSEPATAQHLRDIFYRMGFNDRDIVALSGAHAVGRCHEDASGYWGPWTRAETTFSNEFFRLLKEEKWTKKTKKHESGGCPWKGPDQYESADGSLMMLPSDLVLTKDPAFNEWVEKYKDDEELFFKDFAAAFGKLLALGCDNKNAKAADNSAGGGIIATIKGLVGL
jgi:cytochrome c peroxidase